MGKITQVYYQETEVPLEVAGAFYFNYNMIGEGEAFQEQFEIDEERQLKERNRLLGEARKSYPNLDIGSSQLVISSLKNKVILISPIR